MTKTFASVTDKNKSSFSTSTTVAQEERLRYGQVKVFDKFSFVNDLPSSIERDTPNKEAKTSYEGTFSQLAKKYKNYLKNLQIFSWRDGPPPPDEGHKGSGRLVHLPVSLLNVAAWGGAV